MHLQMMMWWDFSHFKRRFDVKKHYCWFNEKKWTKQKEYFPNQGTDFTNANMYPFALFNSSNSCVEFTKYWCTIFATNHWSFLLQLNFLMHSQQTKDSSQEEKGAVEGGLGASSEGQVGAVVMVPPLILMAPLSSNPHMATSHHTTINKNHHITTNPLMEGEEAKEASLSKTLNYQCQIFPFLTQLNSRLVSCGRKAELLLAFYMPRLVFSELVQIS